MTPLSWAGLGFSLGTLWGLSARPSRWLVLGLLLGSLFAALFWKERKKGGILIFFLMPAFFIGAFSGRERQSAASRMAPFLGNPVRLTGRLEPGSLRVRDRSVSFTLLYEGMRIPVLHLGTLPGPSWGTYTAEGCLEPIETFYNPGMVDETKRSAARKIPGRIRTQNGCLHYEGGEKDALDRIAEWGSTVRKRLSEALPPREAALLGGMLLGGSEGMDASSLQIFTACGLSHLLSVSGSHVALLLGLYVLAAEYLPLPRPVKPLGGLFFLFCYAILCGLRASVWQRRLAGGAVGAPGKRTVFSWLFGPFAAGHPSLLDLGYWLCPLFCGSGRTDALKGEGGTGACIFFRAGPWDGPFCSPRGPYFFPSFACPSFPRREPPIPSSQSASCAAFESFPRSCRQCRFWGSCPALFGTGPFCYGRQSRQSIS